MSIELRLEPSQGIGFFRLGTSLYETVKLMEKHKLSGGVDLQFSAKLPNSRPILLIIKSLDLRLTFEPFYQTPVLIDLLDFNPTVTLSYGTAKIKQCPDLKTIYNKLFGPTYPGIFDPESHAYVLSYAGISFRFPLVDEMADKLSQDDNQAMVKMLDSSHGSTKCDSLSVFVGGSWESGFKSIERCLKGEDRDEKPPNLRKCSLIQVLSDLGLVKIFSKRVCVIQLKKTSMFQVVSQLGEPSDSIKKREKGRSLKIHNYFSLGLDVVYDTCVSQDGSCVVDRIILHQNVITSSEFLRYEKAYVEFAISGEVEAVNPVQFDSYWRQCQTTQECHSSFSSIISQCSIELHKPVFINRMEYNGYQPIWDEKDSNFEMVEYEEDKPRSQCDEDDRSKDWGLSKLIRFSNMIFEVLIETDLVASVTVF